MTKICNDKTGSDKKLHVFCEFIIAAIIGSLVSFIHFPSAWIAAAIAFVVAFAFGIWKEVKDAKKQGNHFCVWDLAWDLVGCLAFVVAFAFGIWKEVKDAKKQGNHFCVWDLAWDLVGCLAGAVVAFLANYYTWHDIAGNLI